jgi:hypothetical protein
LILLFTLVLPRVGVPAPTRCYIVVIDASLCDAGLTAARVNLGNLAAKNCVFGPTSEVDAELGEKECAATEMQGESRVQGRCRGCAPRLGSTCRIFREAWIVRRRRRVAMRSGRRRGTQLSKLKEARRAAVMA